MQGFSLIELLVVTSITLTVAGVAVPSIVTSIANVELRSAVHSASGIVQQGRMDAIKNDVFRKIKYTNATSGGTVFVDYDDDGSPDSNEPQVQMGRAVLAYMTPTGIPALSSTDLGYTPTLTTSIGFSSTGQPCNASHVCAVGMVMYFTDTRSMGSPGWAAVSVAPAGRVQTWLWTGSAWSGN